MTLRERIADWITGGALTRARADTAIAQGARDVWINVSVSAKDRNDKLTAEAANSAAQRDDAEKRAQVAEKWRREAALDALTAYGQAGDACTALRAILTARTITEARKIAKQALGEE